MKSQRTAYASAVNAYALSGKEDDYHEALRIAYNFSSDAVRLIHLLVCVADLKPIVLWATLAAHVKTAQAFDALPWLTTGKKPSLGSYQAVIANARNRAFHNFFAFNRTLDVEVDGVSLKATRLKLFRPYRPSKDATDAFRLGPRPCRRPGRIDSRAGASRRDRFSQGERAGHDGDRDARAADGRDALSIENLRWIRSPSHRDRAEISSISHVKAIVPARDASVTRCRTSTWAFFASSILSGTPRFQTDRRPGARVAARRLRSEAPARRLLGDRVRFDEEAREDEVPRRPVRALTKEALANATASSTGVQHVTTHQASRRRSRRFCSSARPPSTCSRSCCGRWRTSSCARSVTRATRSSKRSSATWPRTAL